MEAPQEPDKIPKLIPANTVMDADPVLKARTKKKKKKTKNKKPTASLSKKPAIVRCRWPAETERNKAANKPTFLLAISFPRKYIATQVSAPNNGGCKYATNSNEAGSPSNRNSWCKITAERGVPINCDCPQLRPSGYHVLLVYLIVA